MPYSEEDSLYSYMFPIYAFLTDMTDSYLALACSHREGAFRGNFKLDKKDIPGLADMISDLMQSNENVAELILKASVQYLAQRISSNKNMKENANEQATLKEIMEEGTQFSKFIHELFCLWKEGEEENEPFVSKIGMN